MRLRRPEQRNIPLRDISFSSISTRATGMWSADYATGKIIEKSQSNLHWHPLNSRHVIMQNLLLAATIPLDGYARPILFNDGALIGLIVLPANAVERLEKSGLVAGHLIKSMMTLLLGIIPRATAR